MSGKGKIEMPKPRLPENLPKLRGTAYRDRSKPSEVAAGRPKQPEHLSEDGKKEWRRIVPLLEQRGTLSKADSAVLALYCETHSRWLQAKRDVAEHGIIVQTTVLDRSGEQVITRKQNPALKIAENAERSLRAFLREFGMTPQSRERVKPTKPATEKAPDSPFAFLDEEQ
jgi:P27 family predicted phage terminase small subunit